MNWTPEEQAELDRITAESLAFQRWQAANRPCITDGCREKALPGRGRCRVHGSSWDRKPLWMDAMYKDPEYLRLRREILASHPPCSYPGCRLTADTIDHIRPVSRGGGNTRENLRPMCRRHNEALGRDLGNATKRRGKNG